MRVESRGLGIRLGRAGVICLGARNRQEGKRCRQSNRRT
jgi:hypothetical protein